MAETEKHSGSIDNPTALIEAIAAEAEEEAEKVRREAERQAEEIVKNAEEKVKTIRREAEERAEQQVESLRASKRQEIEAEERKAYLNAKEELYREAVEKLHSRMERVTREESYRVILLGWVAEGVLALGAEEIKVNGGARERELMDERFLRDATAEAKRAGSGPVSLSTEDTAQPLEEPGVVLSAENGRTVFNNRLFARIERYESRLRRMVYRYIEEQTAEQAQGNREGNE